MVKIVLEQGAYQARSPIANAQVCINLYPENNPKDAPFPVTHYPAPGLQEVFDLSAIPGASGGIRGIYQCSNGPIVVVCNIAVIALTPSGGGVLLGSLLSNTGQPVSMCDNHTTLVIVDGSTNGYMVPLTAVVAGTPSSLTQITDSNFFGSNRVDFIDTFLVFNQPNTQNFYTTTSNVVTPFDPLYFAAKAGWNDNLVCAAVLHDNIWLFGNQTTEIWYNAGAAAFPFARMPNSILQQGCVAIYSVVIADNAVYWLSQDRWGRNMMMRGEGYGAKRVSTYAVENAWVQYANLADCVGMTYQIGGHETVCLYFPTGNAFWAYDVSTQMWHQRTYGGLTAPWIAYCMAGQGAVQYVSAPNVTLVGDRSRERVHQLSEGLYTDNGAPIYRQRSWTHLQGDDGQRVAHTRFAASFAGASLSPDTLALDWSDDAGQTYGTAVNQTIGNATNGQYQWRRLGYARDRVYRLTWQGTGECALNGAYVDVTPHGT